MRLKIPLTLAIVPGVAIAIAEARGLLSPRRPLPVNLKHGRNSRRTLPIQRRSRRRVSLPVATGAGGSATRLRPVTEKIPKALIEINGEPFIAHQLRLLHSRGIRRAVLCVGHLGEMIRDFAGDGEAFGMQLQYSFDGPVLRGTAGAIHQALRLLGDSFFVLYGDSYLPCDYARVQEAFEGSGKAGLMTVYHNSDQWDASNAT